MTETTTTTLHCYNHPDRETMLRCNRCERPICTACAVLTPTGYRCKECVRGQQKTFDTAQWFDYPLAFIVAAVLSMIGGMIASMMGFFIYLVFLVGPTAGVISAEVVRRVTGRRRSRLLYRVATAGMIAGGVFLPLIELLGLALFGGYGGVFSLLWSTIYLFTAVSAFYYRLSGIRLG